MTVYDLLLKKLEFNLIPLVFYKRVQTGTRAFDEIRLYIIVYLIVDKFKS